MQPPKGNITAMTINGSIIPGMQQDINFLDTNTDTSEIHCSLVPFSEQLKHNTLSLNQEITTENIYKKLKPEEKKEEIMTNQQIRDLNRRNAKIAKSIYC